MFICRWANEIKHSLFHPLNVLKSSVIIKSFNSTQDNILKVAILAEKSPKYTFIQLVYDSFTTFIVVQENYNFPK